MKYKKQDLKIIKEWRNIKNKNEIFEDVAKMQPIINREYLIINNKKHVLLVYRRSAKLYQVIGE